MQQHTADDVTHTLNTIAIATCSSFIFFQTQLVSAMLECHSKGVSHRDLKLENMLLDGAFQLKVADFGLAHTEPDRLCTTHCGSLVYMAPEVRISNQIFGTTF
jgi:serine/threonine protein kinase